MMIKLFSIVSTDYVISRNLPCGSEYTLGLNYTSFLSLQHRDTDRPDWGFTESVIFDHSGFMAAKSHIWG